MNRSLIFLLTLASLTASSLSQAQESARQGLSLIANQYGSRSVQWIAEIRGKKGIPQPREWSVVAYDERAPRMLYRFQAGNGQAHDMGVDREFYSTYSPSGYFNANQFSVDSVAAFTIAEGEARKAKMAFDSCNYLLRVREFSNEPVWHLDLLDQRGSVVGQINLSAQSGAVLRTIWIYRNQGARPDGSPTIIDSAAPNQHSLQTQITQSNPANTAPTIAAPPIRQTQPTQTPPSGIARVPQNPQAYRPVDPNGRVIDNSIPEPPAVYPPQQGSNTPNPPTVTAQQPTPGIRDLRDQPASTARPDPTKPPIKIPSTSKGTSGRIPPPPIPQQ